MRRFDFSRRWRKQIIPLLHDEDVVFTLTMGMKLLTQEYREGDPPCDYGRGWLNGQRPRKGCLSSYQPWGRCHHIAPFCWTIGGKVYPDLKWGFLSGGYHTVVVGYKDDWMNPEWVMDILQFREKTAQESLDWAMAKDWKFYGTLPEYAASFFAESEEFDREIIIKIFSNERTTRVLLGMSA